MEKLKGIKQWFRSQFGIYVSNVRYTKKSPRCGLKIKLLQQASGIANKKKEGNGYTIKLTKTSKRQ